MYTAAIAAGSCCAAGAPFAGVVFALELTSTFYVVSNFWFSSVCCFFAFLFYKILHMMPYLKPPNFTEFAPYEINHELIFFAILGLLCARLAMIVIHVLTKIIILRGKLKQPFVSHRWKWCIFVSIVISLCQYPLRFTHFPERQVWNWMFSSKQIEDMPRKRLLS